MNNKGQVLLLSVVVLSGIIASISFFVGYIMIQRLRQAIVTVDSAQAFYLADAGIEYELYRVVKEDSGLKCPRGLSNEENFETKVSISSESDPLNDPILGVVIKSSGHAYKTTRSQQDFTQGILSARCSEEPNLCDKNNPRTAVCD